MIQQSVWIIFIFTRVLLGYVGFKGDKIASPMFRYKWGAFKNFAKMMADLEKIITMCYSAQCILWQVRFTLQLLANIQHEYSLYISSLKMERTCSSSNIYWHYRIFVISNYLECPIWYLESNYKKTYYVDNILSKPVDNFIPSELITFQ